MEIYVIRHGETIHNKKRKFQGQQNIQLSYSGKRRITLKAKSMPKNFDICFSSPLDRAFQTAKLLVPYCKIVKDSRILERRTWRI